MTEFVKMEVCMLLMLLAELNWAEFHQHAWVSAVPRHKNIHSNQTWPTSFKWKYFHFLTLPLSLHLDSILVFFLCLFSFSSLSLIPYLIFPAISVKWFGNIQGWRFPASVISRVGEDSQRDKPSCGTFHTWIQLLLGAIGQGAVLIQSICCSLAQKTQTWEGWVGWKNNLQNMTEFVKMEVCMLLMLLAELNWAEFHQHAWVSAVPRHKNIHSNQTWPTSFKWKYFHFLTLPLSLHLDSILVFFLCLFSFSSLSLIPYLIFPAISVKWFGNIQGWRFPASVISRVGEDSQRDKPSCGTFHTWIQLLLGAIGQGAVLIQSICCSLAQKTQTPLHLHGI